MSGYPQGHYDDGYDHQGHGDAYYHDDHNSHGGYYDNQDYGDGYYDRGYFPSCITQSGMTSADML